METRNQRMRRSVANLTEDLIIEILICLPLISIVRFRCVCKSWSKLIDPNFLSRKLKYDIEHENFRLLVTKSKLVKYHQGYEINVESKSLVSNEDAVETAYPKPDGGGYINIVGSCNGLVCASQFGYIFYVWNPFTGEYKEILRTWGDGCSQKHIIVSGFGYDPKTCDYKFVIIFHRPYMHVSEVEIYSLGSDSWKAYNSFTNYEFSRGKTGVLLKGALHWPVYSKTSHKYGLVSLDLEDGVFKEIPLPKHMEDGVFDFFFEYVFVDVLRDCLCLLSSVPEVSFEIWEMKDYGVRESWSKVFRIDLQQLMTKGIRSSDYIKRVVPLRNCEILLEVTNKNRKAYHREEIDIVKIHLGVTKRRQSRRRYEYMKNILRMDAYVESLVSVNSGTFVGDEQKDLRWSWTGSGL